MAHELYENDFMFSGNGIVPWHGIGSVLDGVLTSEDAIKEARLDWKVIQTPVYTDNLSSGPIPGYLANVRDDTREVLGIVGEKYQVAQNKDVFAFVDELIGTSTVPCTYETAGSLFNGRRVFMLVNMPKGKIVEDEYEPYLCLSNAHDGSSALQIFLTGIRVVCNNTLQAALRTAQRKISIRHLSSMDARKEEAIKAIGSASKYFHDLETFALDLAGKKVNIKKVLDRIFPVHESMTNRQVKTNHETKELIKNLLKKKDDLQNFKGTAWGVYSALADYRSNAEPKRKTETYADNKMVRFLDGDPLLQKAQDIIMDMAA